MNKRQYKKRHKIIMERLKFIGKHINFYSLGRRNGKTMLCKKINRAVMSKSHKPFKELKKNIDRFSTPHKKG